MIRATVLILGVLSWVSLAHAQTPSTDTSALSLNTPASTDTPNSPPDQTVVLLHESLELLQQRQPDAALEKANAAIQIAPKDADAYGLRGGIYAEKKDWDKATQDYKTVLQLDPNNVQAKFNLGEIQFMQKNYDAARSALLPLENDLVMGELASYKVFLCDLFGGHTDAAQKELDTFDKVGEGPSYYFSKAAWYLYQKKPEDARPWLQSAANIYAPAKFKLYSASLFDLGLLPIPPKSPQ
jgi:tetratricopeptide (TPR) repeat protein